MNIDNNISPTPYDDINSFLQIFLDNVRGVLGDYFTGMYLHGSLAGGDFDPGRSDIDFLVVTSEKLPVNLVSSLEAMHSHIYESGLKWAKELNGAYIPLDAVRVYSPGGPECPLVNKKEFLVARPDIDWVIISHLLYTGGVVIAGPPLQSIIGPVRPDELKEAALKLLRDNWTPWLSNPTLFDGIGYQPYVVLAMCRALYTIVHGTVVSKRLSAKWVIDKSDKKWTELINQAMEWHHGDPPGDIGETQEFMRYIMKEAGL